MEDELDDNSKKFELLDGILKRYYNHTMINIKVNQYPPTKVFTTGNFPSKLLDTPISLNWNRKVLLLALYRTDNINLEFTYDKKVTELLNGSLKKNKEKWEKFFSSNEGQYGHCSSSKLYDLVDGCTIEP